MTSVRRLLYAGLLGSGLVLASTAQAFSVSPTVIEMDGGEGDGAVVRITAPGNASLMLDLAIVERSSDGSVAQDAGSVFQLQPPQLFVAAGNSANVRLQWLGQPPASGSRSFYLVAEQLPVAMESVDSQNHLHMLARVHLPVHVGGDGAAGLRITQDERRIVLSNEGTHYARFADLELQIAQSDGGTRSIEGLELARLTESDALLPGARHELDASTIGLATEERAVALVPRP